MTKVLIVGATGLVGSNLVIACEAAGHEVRAMVRPETLLNSSKVVPLKASGVNIIEGSLEDFDSLIQACDDVDVVISAVGAGQLAQQSHLIRAAKQMGVNRFIPSDFGVDPKIAGVDSCVIFDLKATIQSTVRESGLNYTIINANGFFEYWLYGLGQIGLTEPPEEVELYGEGNVIAALVSVHDIARITAATIDDPRTRNKELTIFANIHSQEELIQLWEDISGSMVKRNPVSLNDLEKVIAESTTPDTFGDLIFAQLKRSVWLRGDAGKIAKGALDTAMLYPEIKLASARDSLMNLLKHA